MVKLLDEIQINKLLISKENHKNKKSKGPYKMT